MKPISHTSEWGKSAVDFLQTLYHQNPNAVANVMNMDAENKVDEILECLQAVIDFVSNVKTNLEKEYEAI